ncbi:MAG: TonB-dependent receptor [Burkholderiales bacterium]|nr:TonB-dependent receptor [Burkholderiales bacterium]
MKRNTLKPLAAALVVAGLMPHTAHAQATPTQLDRVEVIGSRIKRINIEDETANPITIVSREEIQRSGVSTTRDLLERLPGFNGNTLSDINGSNSFGNGGTGASLRNLGKQSTLVLLNSRRISAYPLADYNEVFSNLDSLPVDAIERIEVLKSGGSALYGSDAVAGVINIVTRNSFQGLTVSANTQESLKSKQFKDKAFAITGGMGNLATDGFNVLANLDYYRRGDFFWRDVLQYSNPAYKQFSAGFNTFSSYSYPGNVIGQGPVTGCTTFNASKTLCMYDRYERFSVQPTADRLSGIVSAKLKISDHMQGFAEVLYSNTKNTYQSAHATYGAGLGSTVWGDPNTNAARTFFYRGLPAEHPLNQTGEEAEFRYRFLDDGGYNKVSTDQYRVLAGLKGDWQGWDWETAVGVMGGKTTQRQRGLFSDSGFKEVIGDYNKDTLDADFFNKASGYKIGQPNSEAVLSKLFPAVGYDAKTSQTFIDGKVSTELGSLPGGPISLATGFELRHESLKIAPDALSAAGDIVGLGTVRADASRTFGAVFAEADLPLAKMLDAQLAGRLDKFPGFGAHFSPKAALRAQLMPQFMLRGSIEGGFRAPNLTESATSSKSAFQPGVSDPKRCDAASALIKDLLAQADALPDSDPNKTLLQARADSISECDRGVANVARNNPGLKPETSRIVTLGMAFQPAKAFSTTLDYYAITRKNEIGLKGVQDLLSAEAQQPPGTIVRSPNFNNDPTFITPAEVAKYAPAAGRLNLVSGQFENLAKTKTSGIDWTMNAQFSDALGNVSLNFDSTYLLTFKQFSTSDNRYGDNLAGRWTYPRFNFKLRAAQDWGNWTHTLTYFWTSSTTLTGDYFDTTWSPEDCEKNKGLDANQCKVRNYNRLDYNLSWRPTKALTVGANLRNVLGRRPPIDYRNFGQGGIIPDNREDVMGRVLRLAVEYKFL